MEEFSEKLQQILLDNDIRTENDYIDLQIKETLENIYKILETTIVDAKTKNKKYICYKIPCNDRYIKQLAIKNIINNLNKLGFQSCKCDYGTNINCIVLPLKSFILYKTILYGFGGDDEDQADVSCDIVSASGIMIKF